MSRLTYQNDKPVLVAASTAAGQTVTAEHMDPYLDALSSFTADCPILTDQGEVALADVEPGCRVVTRDHGLQEVRWIGRRQFDWRALGLMPFLRPIRVPAGALATGVPTRDITLSPALAVTVPMDDGKAPRHVEARCLLDRPGVEPASLTKVIYVQILLDLPSLVNVGGLWCDSFCPSRVSSHSD